MELLVGLWAIGYGIDTIRVDRNDVRTPVFFLVGMNYSVDRLTKYYRFEVYMKSLNA